MLNDAQKEILANQLVKMLQADMLPMLPASIIKADVNFQTALEALAKMK